MRQNLARLLFIILFCSACIDAANAQFIIDGQYRNRFEIRDGYKGMIGENSGPAVFMSQRTRLSFRYENEFLKLNFSPQDVRLWGDENLSSSTGVFGNDASLDLFEGYAEVRIAEPLWISVGRQQLVYDGQRLLSNRNWNQAGITYDAAVLKLGIEGWKFHLGGSWNTMLETAANNDYPSGRIKTIDYLWMGRDIGENARISLMHLAAGRTGSDTTSRLYFKQTSGLYFRYENKRFSAWGDAYYQYGLNNGGTKVSAWLFDAEAGLKLGFFRPKLGIGYLSGNNRTGEAQTTDHLFDVFYGARHRYFGMMDYFTNFPKQTAGAGLADLYLSLDFKVGSKLQISNTGHYFRLARTNPQTPGDRDLGYENDLLLKYNFRTWGTLETGYAFMLPTATLKTLQGIENEKFPQFIYIQLTLVPTLFTYDPAQKQQPK